MQEPQNEKFKGLRLDQIKSIEKVEDGKFSIASDLVMFEGAKITAEVSEDPSAVVVNSQLTSAVEEFQAGDLAEQTARQEAISALTATMEAGFSDEGEKREELQKELQESIDKEAASTDEDLSALQSIVVANEEDIEQKVESLTDTVSDNKETAATAVANEATARAEAISALTAIVEANESDIEAKVTAEQKAREDGDQNLQDQLDFLLSGSTEEFDQLLEILEHINKIDVDQDESLDAAILSLSNADTLEAETRAAAISALTAVVEANESDIEGKMSAALQEIADNKAAADKAMAEETQARADADAAEQKAREDGDAAEQSARAEAISALTAVVEANESDIEDKVAKEITARQDADEAEQKAREDAFEKLENTVEENLEEALDAVSTEGTARAEAISALTATVEAGFSSEGEKRGELQKELQESIDKESEARADAIEAEQNARAEAISALTAVVEANEEDIEQKVESLTDTVSNNKETAATAVANEATARAEAISALTAVVEANESDRDTEVADERQARIDGDQNLQDQLDFLLSGSTEEFDQLLEIFEHISKIDVDQTESLASAFLSLSNADTLEAETRAAAISALTAVVEANESDIEGKMTAALQAIADGDAAEQKARQDAFEKLENTVAENLQESLDAVESESNARQSAIDKEAAERADGDAAEQKARQEAITEEADKRAEAISALTAVVEANEEDIEQKVESLTDTVNSNLKEVTENVNTAIANAVQNTDFEQSSVSLAGKVEDEVVTFTVAGNTGVILTFVDGLFVPSETAYDEASNQTTVSFTMFFDGDAESKAHYVAVNFS